MKERAKAQRPSGGPEKSRTKTSSSKTSSSKTSASSTKSSLSTSKASSSKTPSSPTKGSSSKTPSSPTKGSSSKTPSSSTKGSSSKTPSSSTKGSSSKTPSSSTKGSSNSKTAASSKKLSSSITTSSSTPKTPSSTASSTTKGLSSTSKTSSSTSKASSSTSKTHSTSSRPAKTTASSTSKTHASEKPAPSSTKTTSSSSRPQHTSSNGEDKSRRHREPSRRDVMENGVLKGKKLSSNLARGDKASPSQNKGKKLLSDHTRGDKWEDKSSTNRERVTDKSNKPRSQRAEHSTSQKVSSRSRHSDEQGIKGRISSDKSHAEKLPQKKIEKAKEKSKSKKVEQNEEERSKDKSSRSREKSTNKDYNLMKNDVDARDSGVEGMSIGPVTVNRTSNGQEMEVVEHTQNSLETMESGISMSSPRDLSGDEVDVEESISSKMVEVDEVEEEEMQKGTAVIDDESLSLRDMGGEYSTSSHYQNMAAVSSELPYDDIDEENDIDEEADYDYEEDFEDYESDFEDDSGSENGEEEEDSEDDSVDDDSDTRTPDPEIAAVLQAIQEENNFENHLQRAFSMDVPDQDEKSLSPEKRILRAEPVPEHHEEPRMPEESHTPISRPKTSRTFVNFAQARKKQIAAQLSSKITGRGRMLLNMIQLDTVSVDLLTLIPISYEAYISSFGHSNRQQIHVQTNEDALCEEVQTDEIVIRNKWTQKPIHISIGKDNQLPGPEDYIGVGGDMDPLEYSKMSSRSNNTAKLTSFLTSASQVMLAILEEELIWDLVESDNTDLSSAAIEGLGFSHPPVPLGASVKSLLEGRPIPFVQFCATESTVLLSGHGYKPLEEGDGGELSEGGLLCVWSVQEPSRPQYLLCCRASPTAATFSPSRPSLVLSGLEDGSLAAWDLREQLQFHTLKIDIDNVNWRVRVPSYITACDEERDGEGSSIVAIQTVTTQQDLEVDNPGSFQVVTLTSDGQVTWWVVVRVPLTSAIVDIGISRRYTSYVDDGGVGVSPHLGAAPWARIALTRAATISVATTLYSETSLAGGVNCHSLKLDPSDCSQLFVATGSGAVARCSRHTSRIHPKSYVPEIEPGCEALCLALCPHDSRYLLVGGGDGVVRLHSTDTDRPLTSWQSAPDSSPIVDLQWSPARPCVFYVLDSHARLHVWDLSAGDIFPVLTVEAGGLVGGSLHAFHIAPTQITSRHPLLSIFASDGGELILRQVSPEFCTYELVEDYNTELERFTYYVNII